MLESESSKSGCRHLARATSCVGQARCLGRCHPPFEAALTVLKALYGRSRPPADLVMELTRSSSFPSGHGIAAAAIAVALVYVFATAGKPARRWFYVAAAYAVAMSLSRTYLRVHWLSDVTIGMVIGVPSVMASVWIVDRFTVRISGALRSMFGWATKKKL